MHRNHLKEMAGQFIEEWHQKLHNNTTPDDVVICTAYLAFLRSNGDVGLFYRTLEQGGVTRDRLRSFERPIRTDPTFYGDKKDALIGEFENFLRILKSVHTGTDLDSAAGAVRGRLSPEANRHLDEVFARRGQPSALANAVTIARDDVAKTLAATGDAAGLRDLLFLDLALQECLRTAMERVNLSQAGRDELMELVRLALRNLTLTVESAELSICTDHWSALMAAPREGREAALHVRSVADRAGRWVRNFSDDTYRQLQPKAEVLGSAFGVESWTIPLFSEEIIRGGPAFTLSLLLRPLDLLLRKAAGIGGWQIISPARADGKVRRVARLLDVQSERFAEPTVLLADAVSGEEEIPANVTAVLTPPPRTSSRTWPCRTRNAGVLFATCFDDDIYQRLVQREGHALALQVTPGGDVQESKTPSANTDAAKPKHVHAATAARRPQAAVSAWVLTQDQFAEGIVGGKSNNLNSLPRAAVGSDPAAEIPCVAVRNLRARVGRPAQSRCARRLRGADCRCRTQSHRDVGRVASQARAIGSVHRAARGAPRVLAAHGIAGGAVGKSLARHPSCLGVEVERACLPVAPRAARPTKVCAWPYSFRKSYRRITPS